MSANDDPKRQYAFEEYVLFYESTEKVTERRLAANRWNYSICSAVLTACAGILGWATSHPSFWIAAILVVLFLCAMALFYCLHWLKEIKGFKSLNKAKFQVLNDMAPLVSFGSEEDQRTSYCPFEKEWKLLEDMKALDKPKGIDFLVLASSGRETLIPIAFQVLFALTFALTILLAVANLDTISENAFIIKEPTPLVTPTQASTPEATNTVILWAMK